jgi:hypothetical protein
MTKAPFCGAETGANPTDRGKKGTKRSVLTDGKGIPLSVVVEGSNRHDKKLVKKEILKPETLIWNKLFKVFIPSQNMLIERQVY